MLHVAVERLLLPVARLRVVVVHQLQVHRLAAAQWSLLRGTPDDTLELAALLGVKFKREASGQFSHSNLITVLNAAGEIIYQQVGLSQDIEETVKAIERATILKDQQKTAHE